MGLLTTAINVGSGAIGAAEFGTKGLIAGGAFGLGAEFLSQKLTEDMEENSVGAAALQGFISGSLQSGFSSMQELYAFKNPNSVQALSSINTTTTIGAEFEALSNLTNTAKWKEAWKNSGDEGLTGIKKINKTLSQISMENLLIGCRPENYVNDVARQGMIKNQRMGEDVFKTMSEAIDKDGGFSSIPTMFAGMAKNQFETIKETVKLGNENLEDNPWFSTEDSVVKGGKTNNPALGEIDMKDVNIKGTDSMQERVAKYISQNDKMTEGLSNAHSEFAKMFGIEDSGMYTADDISDYVRNIKPGALGTHEEISKFSNKKGATAKDKFLGFMLEEKNGSPFWARQLKKQMDNGDVAINKYANIMDSNGKIRIEKMADFEKNGLKSGEKLKKITNQIDDIKGKGKGKLGRTLGLVADIALGGVSMAAAFGGSQAAENVLFNIPKKMLKGDSDKDYTSLKSNKAVNPIY